MLLERYEEDYATGKNFVNLYVYAAHFSPNEHVKIFNHSIFLVSLSLLFAPTLPRDSCWTSFGALLRPPESHMTILFWASNFLLNLSSSGNSRLETV